MPDCCQESYGNGSLDSMNIINQMGDNNLDTEIAKPGEDKYDFEEEMSNPGEIGGNRNPAIYSTDIEPEEEKKFGTNILLDEYGRPKREAGRLVRMSLRSVGTKRNLVRMAKRASLVRMAKRPSPEQAAKRANLVRIAKRPGLVRMAKRSGLVRMAKRSGLVRMAKRPNLHTIVQMLHSPKELTGIKRNQMLRMM